MLLPRLRIAKTSWTPIFRQTRVAQRLFRLHYYYCAGEVQATGEFLVTGHVSAARRKLSGIPECNPLPRYALAAAGGSSASDGDAIGKTRRGSLPFPAA